MPNINVDPCPSLEIPPSIPAVISSEIELAGINRKIQSNFPAQKYSTPRINIRPINCRLIPLGENLISQFSGNCSPKSGKFYSNSSIHN